MSASKKKLPEIKKSLKSFILEDDAKVIDSTASKLAFTLTALSLGVLSQTQNAHAHGHDNSVTHGNQVNSPATDIDMSNEGDEAISKTLTQGKTISVDPKTAVTVHVNHFNHNNDSGGWL